ncbi:MULTISPECIES: hypothetical protein [Nocardia]|uniref:hypothetical protein n=1 Tax=Nocardia TaxID=1817 RepID=UPI0018941DD4|nr:MULTISPECIES: hypothetical protein [Nocardia]MBF6349348.1 hypothetical protein [Nocardia flavorosea]
MRSTATESVDTLLDAGAAGLRFFEVFEPRYREWTGRTPAGGDYFALAARYDQQRGTDLESLQNLATVLAEELDGRLGDQAGTQTSRFGEVPGYWNGSAAADDAHQFLAATGTTISSHLDTLRGVQTAAATAVSQIEDAVQVKADTIKAEFDPARAAGKTPRQIDWFIDMAQGRGDTASVSVQDRLRRELAEYYVDGSDPTVVCRGWLDQVFVTEIDAKISRFTTLCTDAHTAVTGAYTQLVTAVEQVVPTVFVSPAGTPAADTALTTTAGQPSLLAAVGAPQAVTPPEDDNTPTGQNPAQTPLGVPQSPPDQDTPTNSASTSPPAGTEISNTGGQPDESGAGVPAGSGLPSKNGDSTAAGNNSETETASKPGDDSGKDVPDAPAGSPQTAAAAPENWTPADITNMVSAIGDITGTVPDLISAVSDLTGNLDEVIKATGDATATIIDAADNQPSAPAAPAGAGPSAPEAPIATGDQDPQEGLTVNAGDDAGAGNPAGAPGMEAPDQEQPDEEQPVETQPQSVTNPTGDDQPQQNQQSGTPTPPPALGTNPALVAPVSSLRGLAPTPPTTPNTPPEPTPSTAATPETGSSLTL